MWHRKTLRSWLLVPALSVLLLTACGAGAEEGAAPAEELTLEITGPEEGAQVTNPFVIELDSNVPLDDPSTGEHHAHLCIDSDDCGEESEYSLVYGNTFELSDLTPGEHTIMASLRNADHSDAGVGDEITIVVSDGGASTDTSGTTAGSDLGPGY